jgi:cytochrome c biogenesis protein
VTSQSPNRRRAVTRLLSRDIRRPWRALTTMGTALVLLFLLALGAVPGALLPQRSLNESKVQQYLTDHPVIGPWLDRLQMFDVFSSFWFTAIYVLLFISLVGCLTPRIIEHIRSLRATPVPAPRNLSRLPRYASGTVAGTPQEVTGSSDSCGAGGAPPARRARSLKYQRRRVTCASSATSCSTSRCLACWRPLPWARSSATKATSS